MLLKRRDGDNRLFDDIDAKDEGVVPIAAARVVDT
jgi:hypothetical protein